MDVTNEDIGQDITAEEENLDSFASPDEDLADTFAVKLLNTFKKAADENV